MPPPPPGGDVPGGWGGGSGDGPGGTDGTDGEASGGRRGVVIAAIVLLVAGLGAVVAVLALRGDDDSADDEVAPATTLGRDPETTPPTTAAPPTVPGTSAPEPTTTEAPATTTEAPATTEAPTTTAAPPATTEPTETTTATSVPNPTDEECVYLGVDDFGDMQVAAAFTNPVTADGPIDVTIGLYDGDTGFTTATEFVSHALAGERFRIEIDTLEDRPGSLGDERISCRIETIEAGFSFGDVAGPGPSDVCTFVEVDSFDDIQIEFVVTNPFDTERELFVQIALRSDDVRFATRAVLVDPLAPGASTQIAHDTVTEFPAWADPTAFSCDVLTVEGF